MRYLFLSLCVLFVAIELQAQQYEYVPMVRDNASWQIISIDPRTVAPGPPQTPGKYLCSQYNRQFDLTNRDTFLYGHTCRIVLMREKKRYIGDYHYGQSPACEFPDVDPLVADASDRYYMGLREENKRVYNQYSNLLFDFNAEIGDTLPYIGIIAAVDTVQIDTTLRKRFVLLHGGETDTIIEGIGSIRRGPTDFGAPYSFLHYGILTCYSADGKTIYSNPDAPCSAIFPFGTPATISGIEGNTPQKIFPNPFDDRLNIKTSEPVSVKLYNSFGALVLQEKEFKGDIVLSTKRISAGLYFVILEDQFGQSRLVQRLVKE